MAKYFYQRADLVGEALKNLGVLAAGDTPENEDFEYVDEKVDATIEELSALEVARVQDLDQIPLPWFNPLAAYLANSCKLKFSVSAEKAQVLDQEAATALRKLKLMNRSTATYEPLRVAYL